MDTNQYLSMFIDESREHLQAMNDNMLALENAPDDIGIVQNIFRSAHTLKGMSATMGYEDIASLTHEMENVLDAVRNHKLSMDDHIFDCVFKSLDALEAMVGDIIAGGSGKADVAAIVADLKRIVSGSYIPGGSSAPAAANSKPEAERLPFFGAVLDEFQLSVVRQSMELGQNVYFIDVRIRKDCMLKAVRAYMAFMALEGKGEVIRSNPSVEDIEADKFDFQFSLFFISEAAGKELEAAIADVSEIESVTVSLLDADSLQQIARGKEAAAEIAAAVSTAPAVDAPDSGRGAAEPKSGQAAPARPQAAQASRTIRVDIERLDILMNLFSELLIDRVRLEQLASEVKRSELTETVEHMSRVSSDLQNIVMKLRMMPVDSVFNRFPRMVRDLAKSLDKKVELVVSGAETELDRTVIDEIGDPLVHLLRNSLDHGVESVAERLAAGKPETGTVHLRAFHSGNHVYIEIEDDGKGINRDIVLKKAIKNGIVTAEDGERMKDEEVYQLLFASGFSTAEVISDISGRGVGLDVVRSKITSLGGHVHVSSRLGLGTKFSIQLPLTLSIISAMMIKLGSEKYAIPLTNIVETAIVASANVHKVHGNKMITYRSSVIPLVSLSRLLEVPDYSEEGEDETEVVIIRKGEKLAALMVDELIGQQEIVLKSLGNYLSKVFAVSGATILGDGQVALIIDPNAIIK
ncbi:chemotaxis protein CheA [Paenibacillus thermotolerans]|uniref:chemotaxis protein CheA n=1 Tax=Paenibacillus thermotolerans TaxID=3027807 RepID=UPI00236861F4|nr:MULTISPECIES: chemotaxis protein CheA [unclassified Paenibacillus]